MSLMHDIQPLQSGGAYCVCGDWYIIDEELDPEHPLETREMERAFLAHLDQVPPPRGHYVEGETVGNVSSFRINATDVCQDLDVRDGVKYTCWRDMGHSGDHIDVDVRWTS